MPTRAGIIMGATAILAAHICGTPTDARVASATSFKVDRPYRPSPVLRAAAAVIMAYDPDTITPNSIENGSTLSTHWFNASRTDAIFFIQTNPLDYPQACFAREVSRGAFTFAGCATTSSNVIRRINRGALTPWLSVRLDRRTVDYCWDGATYLEKMAGAACR